MRLIASIVCIFLAFMLFARAEADEASKATISAASKDEQGFLVHAVKSPFQSGETQIRVLPPDELKPGEKLPVVYVLPVEALNEARYGNGLLEIKRLDLPNKHRAIFVAPTFSHLPWYADHPTNPEIRQESYLLEVVIPFVDKTYPVVAEAKGRYLLGFSKSGWGAWSLLLRHPECFAKASAWDAPLMMDRIGLYGSGEILATQENFNRYRIDELLRMHASELQSAPRLVLTGYDNFREHHERARQLLLDLKIPHQYRDGPKRKHDWHSGWVAEAVELLLGEERSE